MYDFTAKTDFGWLDEINCKEMEGKQFFVEAGHVIAPKVLDTCRECPVRAACINHAYQYGITGGYFGGMSPGQRRDMSLEEALAFAAADLPRAKKD